ncbi:hypothetical protein GGX14DRAFT_398956 [Mycena pura]|uniref:Uncharacterized protein n=1 Tax=Mycena pura TaxID=153505 RepID=A0AAD6Y639_9AGAR|nr:hypothetical protein GGX14DRAFT_398956 [Mycena pura]
MTWLCSSHKFLSWLWMAINKMVIPTADSRLRGISGRYNTVKLKPFLNGGQQLTGTETPRGQNHGTHFDGDQQLLFPPLIHPQRDVLLALSTHSGSYAAGITACRVPIDDCLCVLARLLLNSRGILNACPLCVALHPVRPLAVSRAPAPANVLRNVAGRMDLRDGWICGTDGFAGRTDLRDGWICGTDGALTRATSRRVMATSSYELAYDGYERLPDPCRWLQAVTIRGTCRRGYHSIERNTKTKWDPLDIKQTKIPVPVT